MHKILLLIHLCILILGTCTVSAQEDYFFGAWQQVDETQIMHIDTSIDDWIQKNQQFVNEEGMMLVDFEHFTINGEDRFFGLYERNSEGANYWWTFYATYSEWEEKNREYFALGYYLTDFEVYTYNNWTGFFGLWHTLPGNWQVRIENSFSEWETTNRELTERDGFLLKEFEKVKISTSSHKYIGVWQDGELEQETALTSSYAEWDALNKKMQDRNLKLVDFDVFEDENGNTRFFGAWQYSDSNQNVGVFGSIEEWTSKDEEYKNNGFHLVDFEKFEAGRLFPTPNWECTIRSSLDGESPGYTWILLKDGEMVDSLSNGYARAPWETENPGLRMSTQTPIHLAGISQTITAVALLKLIQDDLSLLDQPFWEIIKDHPQVTNNPAEVIKSISLKRLLQKRSGILEQTDPYENFWDQLNTVLESGNVFSFFSGNDADYAILQLIIEVLGGQSYESYVREHIFEPLGMDDMMAGPGQINTSLAYSKQTLITPPPAGINWPDMPFSTANQGWIGSALSVAKLLKALRSGAILPSSVVELLYSQSFSFQFFDGEYGIYYENSSELFIPSAGKNPGFSAAIYQFPLGYDIILLANRTGFSAKKILTDAFESSCSVCAIAGPGILSGCQEQDITLAGQVKGGTSLTYKWDNLSGDIISGSASLSPRVNSSGFYTLIVMDSITGCTAQSSIKVVPGEEAVDLPPIPLPVDLTCTRPLVTINPDYGDPAPLDFQWETNIGRIVSDANTPSPKVDAPGIYYLTVRDTENNCTATTSVVINSRIRNEAIEVEICAGENYLGYTEAGSYIDTLATEDDCTITEIDLTVLSPDHVNCLPTTTSNSSGSDELFIYPNPTRQFVHLNWSGSMRVDFRLFDIHGQSLSKGILQPTETTKLDLQGMPSGLYFIKIASNEGAYASFKIADCNVLRS